MGSIDRLKSQHAALEQLLGVLERQVRAVERLQDPDYHLMRDILHYLTEYADRYHHPYEDVLYRRLADRAPAARAAVAERQWEHLQLAGQGRLCRRRIEQLLDGQVLPRQALAEPGLAYLAAYRAHLRREREQMLPLAVTVLRPADWLQIDTVFHWQDDPLFGAEVAAAYRSLHDRMQIEGALPALARGEAHCAACGGA